MSKYEKGSLGWLKEKAKEHGFGDNIRKYIRVNNQKRKEEKNAIKFYKELEKKYGKEFVEFAQQNRGKIPDKYLKAGCKNWEEYFDKNAKNMGYNNSKERAREYKREWLYETGKCLPKEINENCSLWFGEFISQNYVMETFENPIKMHNGNPGFDWICKKGEKIDHKGACLTYIIDANWSGWVFGIEYNNIADWFILSAWDSRDSLVPLHVWIFHKNDIIRERKFWRRDSFSITDTPKKLKELEKWEVTNRLEKLKELCDKSKEE